MNIYIWQNDHYVPYGSNLIAQFIQKNAPGISSHVVDDIVKIIRNIKYKTPEEFAKMQLPASYIPVRNGLVEWQTGVLTPP
ncbi:MAG: hypothetical protein ACP5IB_08620 [Thermoplasmata archaeon]